jgi:DNA-binding NtrC family response regulator
MYLSNDANLDNISNISELRLLDKEIVSKDIRIKTIVINHQNRYPDTELSKRLGISRKSLWEKRKKLEIDKKK